MTDIGIVAYGAYVPWYRLSRKTISTALSWLGSGSMPGEKAVANHDEDTLTMAVNASTDCLKEFERENIDSMYLATTTSPYRERENAVIGATALDLRPGIRTADFSNSLKAGTTALLCAGDSVKASAARNVLVCAADCRLGRPGSSQEMSFGDSAASFIIGSQGVIASLEGSYSVSYDFPDFRRTHNDTFVRGVEDRFIREEGYTRFIPEAVSGLLKAKGMKPKDIARVAFPCLNPRDHAAIGKRLGFEAGQIQSPLLGVVGESGTASPLMLLIAMLEEASPADNILICSYGSGAEALLFKATDEIKSKGKGRLKQQIETNKDLGSYEKYLAFRGLFPLQVGTEEGIARTELPLTWRERKTILALYGSQCKKCGTPQYPPQSVCTNPECGAINEMEAYRFSDKKGTIFSFTEDHAAIAYINPPLIYGMIDFEGGGRFLFEITDCEPGSLNIGMPVKMSFRRKYQDESRGVYGYFWKAVPAG